MDLFQVKKNKLHYGARNVVGHHHDREDFYIFI